MNWARWLGIVGGMVVTALMLGLAAFQATFLLNVTETNYANLLLPAFLFVFNLGLAIAFARVTYRIWAAGRQ